jgi:hypothetical protein
MSTQTDLAELYTTFFNRAPDADGLAYWVNEITSGNINLTQIAENWMTQQPEGLTTFPSTLTDAQFIDKIYGNILGRAADTDGAQYWLDQLATGTLNRDSFAATLINGAKANTSAQGVLDSTLISNKATVGIAFADKGLNDVTLATKVLTSVNADASTLNGTLAVISLIPAAAADQTAAILATANQLLTNFATLISTAPSEVADAATYLQTILANASSTTNLTTLLANATALLNTAATNPAALDNPAAQGSAAVVEATPAPVGGTPTDPTVFVATANADNFTLTSAADTFTTKFGGGGATEVNTLTFTGNFETGDVVTVSGLGPYSAKVTVGDPLTLAVDIAAAVTKTAYIARAVADGNTVKITAFSDGIKLPITVTAVNKTTNAEGPDTTQSAVVNVEEPSFVSLTALPNDSSTPTAQVNLAILSGPYGEGDVISLSGVATNIVTYTVSAEDVAAGTYLGVLSAIAAKVVDAVNNAPGSTVTVVSGGGINDAQLLVTAKVPGTGFNLAVSAVDNSPANTTPQIDSIELSGSWDTGDTITVDGYSDTPIVYISTVDASPNNLSDIYEGLSRAINSAADAKVTANFDNLSQKLILTAKDLGEVFNATVTATNREASAESSDNTQAVTSTVTTAAVKPVYATSSYINLDVINGFEVGTDKINLQSYTGTAVATPTSLTHLADFTTGVPTDSLWSNLVGSFEALATNAAGVVNLTAGDHQGTYLLVNDGAVGLNTGDVVIKLTGTVGTIGPVGALAVSDFFA